MAFAVDALDDGGVRAWSLVDGGATARRVKDYAPSVYVAGPTERDDDLAGALAGDPKVVEVARERWYTSLHDDDRAPVLRVDLERLADVRPFAREVRHRHEPDGTPTGTYRLFNVDLTPQFRYCLETGTSPVPAREPTALRLELSQPAVAAGTLEGLVVGDEAVDGDEARALDTLERAIERTDPDVLVVDTAEIVPLAFERAEALGRDGFRLGRLPGYARLSGGTTYESYGQVGYKAPRYHVPGRVVLDTSNSFLWHETSLAGILDLVERSHRPLEETGWASIGTVLTAIQTRRALERGVLVPWNKWEPEVFKDVRTLHAADRGGFTFAPEVGLHEGVVEVDFASLYPRIICEYNVSPDTIRCDCDAEHRTAPEIGYAVCTERGFLADVLQPLLDDRAAIKAALAEADDPERVAELRSRSGALKWILVSCFGYQGYRNSKFGRIECHEAINAYARDILLRAKERFEAGGWRVVHGIVDSLWVEPVADDPEPVGAIADDVTDEVGIDLDPEGRYEWVCFVPRRGREAGALTKYFGRRDDGGYKLRGIEARQRSTAPFVAEAQRAYVEALDRHREPAPVCDRLGRDLARLGRGDVEPADLLVLSRLSRPLSAYQHRTLPASAMARSKALGVERHPGQDVRYLVVDADPEATDRVRLHFEALDAGYDASFYRDRLVRACESVVSPLGWDRDRIETYLRGNRTVTLGAFG
ncbi:MAG: type B DNA-directed DNA polymerase [Halobacteriales archaeon]